jgi:hypothetical protein
MPCAIGDGGARRAPPGPAATGRASSRDAPCTGLFGCIGHIHWRVQVFENLIGGERGENACVNLNINPSDTPDGVGEYSQARAVDPCGWRRGHCNAGNGMQTTAQFAIDRRLLEVSKALVPACVGGRRVAGQERARPL